jgi:peptidoglycan/xylan/chitin deacetylase (PgdA/CDA1 family)
MITLFSHANKAVTTAFALVLAGAAIADDAVPSARIARFAGDRAAAISYTFDDGLRDQYTVAVPMLNEAGFKGTFFVIPGKTAESPEEGERKQNNPKPSGRWGGICWAELRQMAKQGHEIASHTWSHRGMRNLTPEEVDAELGKACEAIETHIGKPPLAIAFPYNQSTPGVQVAALRHHVAFRSYQLGLSEKSTTASLNAWADKQVRDNTWGVAMAHAIAHGYAELSDPEILRSHLKYVKDREREIWVDTFSNIARYEKERDGAKLELSGRIGSVTCVVSTTLDSKIYNVPLTIVIDAPGVTSASAKRSGQDLPASAENGTIHVQAAPDKQPITITWH